jgi:hypothetical protein
MDALVIDTATKANLVDVRASLEKALRIAHKGIEEGCFPMKPVSTDQSHPGGLRSFIAR